MFLVLSFFYNIFFVFACLFSKKREKKHGVGFVGSGNDLGGQEGGETMIRI